MELIPCEVAMNKGLQVEYTKLGQSALNVSKVCLGTMTFGDQNTQAEAVSYTHLDVYKRQSPG